MDNNTKRNYYANLIARKIQTAFLTTPELSYLLTVVVVIFILFILAKLFIHLP